MQNFWPQIWIQHRNFNPVTNSYIPRGYDFNFVGIMVLRIYKALTVTIAWGVSLHPPRSIFTVKSLMNNSHKVRITNTKIMKICIEAKIWVMNVNLRSEISYDPS